MDIFLCLMLIPLLPVNIFVIGSFSNFILNWLQVFSGQKTWVGFAGANVNNLPALKNGVISDAENFGEMNLDVATLSKLNWLYAKHYSVGQDLRLWLVNYRKLGK